MAVKGTGPGTFPAGECTRYADDRYKQLTGWYIPFSGDAKDWATNARKYGWTVSASPVVPSIACLQPGIQGADGTFGHVAVVEGINNNTVTTTGLNWGSTPSAVATVNFQVGSGILFIYATDSSGKPLAWKSGKNPSPGGGTGLPGSNGIWSDFNIRSDTVHNLLNNVPGFQGIFEALDQIEQFQPFAIPNKSTGTTSDPNVGTILGVISAGIPFGQTVVQGASDIAQQVAGSKNIVNLPADAMQAGLVFVTSNSLAFIVRALITLVGLVLFFAMITNVMTEFGGQLMDSGVAQTAMKVATGA